MINKPKVSILCPAYNHERFVKYFIQSVLNQTEQDFELLIVDDNSTDNTVGEIEKFTDSRIKFFKHEYNKGINAGINELFSLANGTYCVLIGSDDILKPNHLKTTTEFLDKNPNVGVYYSSLNLIDDENNPIDDKFNVFVKNNCDRFDLLKKMFFNHNVLLSPGMVIRKTALEKIMPLDLTTLQYQDYQMHIKLMLNNEIYQTEEKLVDYRIISENKNISARTSIVLKREELEEYSLMNTYLEIEDLKLLKNIFKEEIVHIGEPIEAAIPYFLGILALSATKEIRKNWGFHTIMNFLKTKENFELIHKTYGISFKSYIDLVNCLDVNNTFAMNSSLIKIIKHQMANKEDKCLK